MAPPTPPRSSALTAVSGAPFPPRSAVSWGWSRWRTSGGQRPNFSPPSRVDSARAAWPAATFVSSRSASAWASVSSAGMALTLWCKRPAGNAGLRSVRPDGTGPEAQVAPVEEDVHRGAADLRREPGGAAGARGPGAGPRAGRGHRGGLDAKRPAARGGTGPGLLAIALQGVRHRAAVLDDDARGGGRDAHLAGLGAA